jgi:aryl-alcohol dehydrogenase-like predicted oxidoreductase
MEALHDLVKSGKVRYIGASSMWAVQFASMQFVAEKRGWTKFISMQNHYNLLYREEEREMNRFCNDTGVGLIPVSLHCLLATDVLTMFTVGSTMPRPPCAPALVLWRDDSIGG